MGGVAETDLDGHDTRTFASTAETVLGSNEAAGENQTHLSEISRPGDSYIKSSAITTRGKTRDLDTVGAQIHDPSYEVLQDSDNDDHYGASSKQYPAPSGFIT